jgi:DNA-directed RNA polymerase sigma subunit (sigma70/sigma32)
MTKEKNKKAAKQNVRNILSSLTDRERKTLKERFGKIDENSDFDSIETLLEKTRLRIREIEAKALRKLKRMRNVPPDDIA